MLNIEIDQGRDANGTGLKKSQRVFLFLKEYDSFICFILRNMDDYCNERSSLGFLPIEY